MKIIETPDAMRSWSRAQRQQGKTIGLVPTMGALHQGHLSLMRACVERDDVGVASIFVNPAQFAPHEDLDRYPRTFESDCARAEEVGMDLIYAPSAASMYPEGYATYVEVERLQDHLCGSIRPHFFRGVATVVSKLFNTVEPDRAYFGQKDAQQSAIIRRMVRDLDYAIEVVVLPTVREKDGLAMSSRNAYLSEEERTRALCLSRSLDAARSLLESGERNVEKILDTVKSGMSEVEIDYALLVDADEISPLEHIEKRVLLAVAVRVGETRLIDNTIYEVSEPC